MFIYILEGYVSLGGRGGGSFLKSMGMNLTTRVVWEESTLVSFNIKSYAKSQKKKNITVNVSVNRKQDVLQITRTDLK